MAEKKGRSGWQTSGLGEKAAVRPSHVISIICEKNCVDMMTPRRLIGWCLVILVLYFVVSPPCALAENGFGPVAVTESV